MQDYLSEKARSITPYTAGAQPEGRRIVKLNTLFPAGGRTYTMYMEVFVTGAGVMPISLEGEY